MSERSILYAIIILALSMPLAGCGIKPGRVAPPPGAEEIEFPRTYPDLRTDPPPMAR